MLTKTRATMDDLYATPGKAELVNGELVRMSPTGGMPGYAGDEIFVSLHSYVRMTNFGHAVGDNKGFLAHLPHRESFSPDAAFYLGPPATMKFFPDVPVFAAEVRSEGDYGPKAEAEMAAKWADYFAAGCKVVWDVDLLGRGRGARPQGGRPRSPDPTPPGRDRRGRTRRAGLDDAGGRPIRVAEGLLRELGTTAAGEHTT